MESDQIPASDLVIRVMTQNDLEMVSAIDREASPIPWSRDTFINELNAAMSRNLVAVSNGTIVGYIGFWIVAEEIQIQNVIVDKDYRRRGIASRLLNSMIEIARSQGVLNVTLEVRSRNKSAISLYVKNGFVVKGVRRKYYDNDGDDALIMWADL
jgi:[ribosomal protein S18]-alanine N-acetyltransferase